MPSTATPRLCWKWRTAASVRGPKMPSTVSPAPWLLSRCCSVLTGCSVSPWRVSGQGWICVALMGEPPFGSLVRSSRERDEEVQCLRVRERVAAGGQLRRRAHQDPLDGQLEHLAGQRARDLVDGHHLVRNV